MSALKVLIKKIFPPKKCLFTVDTTGDGLADSIQINVLNVIIPFSIPKKIEIGDFNSEEFNTDDFDVSDFARFSLDGEPINISKNRVNKEAIQEQLIVYHKGESFKIDDLLSGKMSGRTIAMGDTVSILIKLKKEDLQKLTEGKHILTIEGEKIPKLEISFELNKNNTNLKFNP